MSSPSETRTSWTNQKFPSLCVNWRFITVFKRILPVLSHINPVHLFTPCCITYAYAWRCRLPVCKAVVTHKQVCLTLIGNVKQSGEELQKYVYKITFRISAERWQFHIRNCGFYSVSTRCVVIWCSLKKNNNTFTKNPIV